MRNHDFKIPKASENVIKTTIFSRFCLSSIDFQALWLHSLLKLTRNATFWIIPHLMLFVLVEILS
jgi:hypothetical protein